MQEPLPPIENMKKIVFYRGDRSQCFLVRGHMPLAHIAKNHREYMINITSMIDKEHIGKFDLAIFQRQYKAEVFHPMMAMKNVGTKLVFEIDDDLFNIPDWNPAKKIIGKKAVQENLKYYLSNVDAIFVTNQRLFDLYKPYCEKVYILPNCIDPAVFHPSPKNSKRKVILWAGSDTHAKDVQLVKPAIERLAKEDDVQVKLWHIDLKVPNTYLVPFCPLEAFYNMLAQVDPYIGLAPLTTVPFNKGKSNLKFLEYAMQKAATIASNFGPYAETIEHEKTGILVDDNRDWYDVIRYLIRNEDKHAEITANAREFVEKKYNIANNYVAWKNAIDEVMQS